ncbi:MAG TPA: hypothetical protein VEK07_20375 [Polyangiaceae bacterium]|nr:hypothetical protein [Polyangiaceae bacterium]
MKRLAVGTLVGAILSFFGAGASVGGCGPADDSSYPYAGYAGSYGTPDCSQYTSCAACTPLVGCGWCAFPDGTGTCASGPDNCSTEWIWEPNFCSVTSDAGSSAADATPADATWTEAGDSSQTTSTLDAALDADSSLISDAAEEVPWDSEGPPDGIAPGEAAADAALDASSDQATPTSLPIIADGGGCAANDGSLCGSSQPYGVTCTEAGASTDVPEPPPSLECSVVAAPTPAGTLYYCCSNAPSAPPSGGVPLLP